MPHWIPNSPESYLSVLRFIGKKYLAALPGFLITLLIGYLVTDQFEHAENRRFQESIRADVQKKISHVRANIEKSVFTRSSLVGGMQSFMYSSPAILDNQKWFNGIAMNLYNQNDGAINVSMTKATTVKLIFPEDRNRDTLGIDLLDLPKQRESVLKAIATRKTTTSGPFDLIQGGRGFEFRAPVFQANLETNNYDLLGMSCLTVDEDVLINEMLENAAEDTEFALRCDDWSDKNGGFVTGSVEILYRKPESQTINIPNGSWLLYAIPKSGWIQISPQITNIRLRGAIATVLTAVLIGLLISTNVARGEALELAESASKAKSDFLSKVSHELRTPLTAIRGFAQELLTREQEGESRDFLSIVDRNARHLQEIVGDILDYSRIEAQSVELDPECCDPTAILNSVVNSLKLNAKSKSLILEGHPDKNLPQVVLSDEGRLRQILFNLIGNAIKFTNQGRIDVGASASSIDNSSAILTFTVKDTGIGIPQELQNEIFSPFTQADSFMSRVQGGTGLGLGISKSLCQILGGDLTVESELGSGSLFTATVKVDLPEQPFAITPDQKPEPATPQPASPPTPALAPGKLVNRTILLAEDGLDNQRLLQLLMKRQGASVVIANNGAEALDWIDTNQNKAPDLIILDIQMPVMDGYEAARQIRQRKLKVPIAALTAHADLAQNDPSSIEIFDLFMTKPIERNEFIEQLAQAIEKPSGTEETSG